MRIVVCTLNYPPEVVGVGKYSGEMCEWLHQQGHEVRVVCGYPYYPEWRLRSGFHSWCYTSSDENGVRISRCPIWVPRIPTTLRRVLHLLSFGLSSFFALSTQIAWSPDLVIMIEPTLAATPGVLALSAAARAIRALHIQDFELDAAEGLGLMHGSGVLYTARRLDGWLCKKFDVVSTLSQEMAQKLDVRGVAPARQFLMPNWCDSAVSAFASGSQDKMVLDDFGVPRGSTVVLYSGSIGAKQGLHMLLDVADAMAGVDGVYFMVCGDGPERADLERSCAHRGLRNIGFFPLQSVSVFHRLLVAADIHILFEKPGVADSVMPSKLGNMLASGRPVIAAANGGGAIDAVLQASGAGIRVEPGDAVGFVDALSALSRDQNRRASMGSQGRGYAAAHLSKDSILQAYLERIANRMSQTAD